MAEEPQGVEEPEHTKEQKETVGVGQANETGEAIRPVTVAAPTTATTLAMPATPTASPAAPASSLAEPPVDKPSSAVQHEANVPPPSRPKIVENNKIDFLEGPCLLSRYTENVGGGSGSKSCVLSSSCGVDRDTLCIVVSFSFFRFLRN